MRLVFALLAFSVVSAPSPSQLVFQGNQHAHSVALTFDAGADRGYALRILMTLERNHVHATFGMTGKWAEQNRDLIRRMSRDGDMFINHTYDHRSFTGFSSQSVALSRAQRIWEVTQTDRIIRKLTGRSTLPYFRPPFGDYDPATLTLMRELGYRYTVMWTVDSLGWEHLSASAILQRCLARLIAGDIYLMHVGIQSQDAFALPNFLSALHRAHYQIVTVAQLIAGH